MTANSIDEHVEGNAICLDEFRSTRTFAEVRVFQGGDAASLRCQGLQGEAYVSMGPCALRKLATACVRAAGILERRERGWR